MHLTSLLRLPILIDRSPSHLSSHAIQIHEYDWAVSEPIDELDTANQIKLQHLEEYEARRSSVGKFDGEKISQGANLGVPLKWQRYGAASISHGRERDY